MRPDRFQREYIAYEIPADAIFNHDVWQFDQVVQVKGWSQVGNKILLKLLTAARQQAVFEMAFYRNRIVRFRLYRDEFTEEPSDMLVAAPSPAGEIHATVNNELLQVKTSALTVLLKLNEFGCEIRDEHDQLVQRFYLPGKWHGYFPSYPLGWQVDCEQRERTFVNFELQPEEALFGFGEKFSPLNKRGYRINSWQSDTTGCCWDRSYKNIPFFLSSRGYGVFIHHSARIQYEPGSHNFNALTLAVEKPHIEYYFFYGPSFKKIIEQYTLLTGRAPMPPRWSFGLWMSRFGYKNWDEIEQVVTGMRSRGIPLDVIHIDPYWMREKNYCDFVWDEKAFPDPTAHLKKLRSMGVRVCLWEQPFIPVNTERFHQAHEKGYLVRNRRGQTYVMTDFEDKPVGIVDFTNPDAAQWYKNIHKKLLRQGVATFKPDMGEALPQDAVLFNGKSGKEMHNLYPLLYNKTVFEACREFDAENAVVWGRSGYAGSQRYPLNWSGDPHSTAQDMACVLRGGLSYGLSGVPFWSHDIGGFHGDRPSPWLYIRWAQFGLLSSHSRAHGCQPREPWEYGREAEEIFRKFARLRYRLLPYLWTCAKEACDTGLPVLRAMVLEFQHDPVVKNLDLQYMLGPALLIAPVFDESNRVQVYLPQGQWLDFWTEELLTGPVWVEQKVPLDSLPLYIRQNSVIPTGPEMNFVGESAINPLRLDVFVADETEQTVVADRQVAVRFARLDDQIIGSIKNFSGDLVVCFHSVPAARQVQLIEGRADPEWEYDPEKSVLLIHLKKVLGDIQIKVSFGN